MPKKTSKKILISKKILLKEKLLNIQCELKSPKGQFNAFGKYNYRSCEDILKAVKPILKKYKALVVLKDRLTQFGDRYYIEALAKLTDIESDDSIVVTAYAREEESKKGMDGSQITGASSSYARKYALNGLFGIDDARDSDTTNKDGNKNVSTSASSTKGYPDQKELMKQHGMDDSQVPPKCPNCGATMMIFQRKDKSGIFWSCKNWRTKSCKGYNIDEVEIDGTITMKQSKPVAQPKNKEKVDVEDIPF